MRALSKVLARVAVTLAIAYAVICLLLYFGQARLIFFPSPGVGITPREYSVAYQDVSIPVDGGELHGWWLPADSRRALLYMHGNGGNIAYNLEQAIRFQRMGFSVLIFDYRGYGRSSGPFPSEKRVYQDAEAAWDHLTSDLHVPPGAVYLYGHSLGGAVAIEMAVRHPEAAGLIAEGTFTSAADLARRDPVFRLFPVRLILRERFESIEKVPRLRLPVLYLHGTVDRLVPSSESEHLLAASPEPKRLVFIPGGGHDNVALGDAELYLSAIRDFVAAHPPHL